MPRFQPQVLYIRFIDLYYIFWYPTTFALLPVPPIFSKRYDGGMLLFMYMRVLINQTYTHGPTVRSPAHSVHFFLIWCRFLHTGLWLPLNITGWKKNHWITTKTLRITNFFNLSTLRNVQQVIPVLSSVLVLSLFPLHRAYTDICPNLYFLYFLISSSETFIHHITSCVPVLRRIN